MIQITFTPETPAQAAVVAEAIGKYLGTVAAGETVAEVEEPAVTPKPKARKAAAPAPVSASAAGEPEVPNETAAAPSEPEVPAASTASSPVAVTLEDVRGVLAKLSQGGKAAEVKGLISKFGAAKLTEIPADKYADVLAAAQEL